MRIRGVWSLVGIAAGAAIAVAPAAPSTVSAASSAHARGLTSYVPLRSSGQGQPADFNVTTRNMDYNGGPLMPSSTNYIVFWSSAGLGGYGPEYVSGLSQYFTDLAHDSGGHQNTDSVAAQYNDLTGAVSHYAVTFGGALLDTDPYPTSQCPVNSPVTECMTDAQLQQELETFTAANHLPTDFTHEYFLMTPPHVEGCFSNDPTAGFGGCSAGEVPSSLAVYCAYHGQTTLSPMLLYADDPFVTGITGCDDGNHPNGPSDGALEGGLSHEHNESITDPIPNVAWTAGSGKIQGFEVGDVCDGKMGPSLGVAPNGAKFNQVINGHFYWYQEEWSNVDHTCLQRLGPLGSKPTATFTASAGSGLSMSFDATGSTAPGGGVADYYVWQFNDSFGAQTIEQKTPIITHTFPASGAYSIGLTVFAHDGLSTGTGAIITTEQSGFTPGFSSSPTNPTAGQTIAFNGLTTVSQQPVVTYSWDFGDGTTGSGANPTHSYATVGNYRVKVVLFSGVGSAFPGAGAAPVYAHTIAVS